MEHKSIIQFKVIIDEVVPSKLANIFGSIENDSRFEVRKMLVVVFVMIVFVCYLLK